VSRIRSIDGRRPDPDLLRLAATIVRGGGVIVYPTDTVYGIGATATDAAAVERVLAVKGRPSGKPLLVVVHTREAMALVAEKVPPEAEAVMNAFWPGPLTIVVRAREDLPRALTGGTGTVGIRIPSHPVTLRLLEVLGLPLVSTSANRSGSTVAPTVASIEAQLGEEIDLYLDAGLLPPSPPSTVLDLSGDLPRMVREGAVAVARLRAFLPSLASPARPSG